MLKLTTYNAISTTKEVPCLYVNNMVDCPELLRKVKFQFLPRPLRGVYTFSISAHQTNNRSYFGFNY